MTLNFKVWNIADLLDDRQLNFGTSKLEFSTKHMLRNSKFEYSKKPFQVFFVWIRTFKYCFDTDGNWNHLMLFMRIRVKTTLNQAAKLSSVCSWTQALQSLNFRPLPKMLICFFNLANCFLLQMAWIVLAESFRLNRLMLHCEALRLKMWASMWSPQQCKV